MDGNENSGKYIFLKVQDSSEPKTKLKAVKRYISDEYCEILGRTKLIRWVVMNKLGLIEDCEIFQGEYDGKCRVDLVQKLWNMDLQRYIDENPGMLNMFSEDKPRHLALLLQQICPKLKIMHDNDIVFTDIKPSNICMDYDKSDRQAIEFGIIDYQCLVESNKILTHAIGTRHYRAPEMPNDRDVEYTITTKFDIFSLGITILELISGKHFMDELSDEQFDEYKYTQQDIDKWFNGVEIFQNDKHRQLKDLLQHMTFISVEDRYDIDEVMNHQWFQEFCIGAVDMICDPSVCTNGQRFMQCYTCQRYYCSKECFVSSFVNHEKNCASNM